MFGEVLYGLTPKDTQGVLLQVVHEKSIVDTVIAAAQADIFTVPDGYFMALQSMSMYVTASGGITPNYGELSVIMHGVRYGLNYSNMTSRGLSFQGFILAEPGAIIHAEAGFTGAGAPLNHMEASVLGYLIPRGTFAVG